MTDNEAPPRNVSYEVIIGMRVELRGLKSRIRTIYGEYHSLLEKVNTLLDAVEAYEKKFNEAAKPDEAA